MSANSINKWDLLWRYYVLTSRYPEAASILRDLADAPGCVALHSCFCPGYSRTCLCSLNLAQRVQYLSFAVGHAKSQYPSSGSDVMQQFVRDVENRLDVAQIQIEIHAVLEGSTSLENRDELLKRLDEDLFSVSDVRVPCSSSVQVLTSDVIAAVERLCAAAEAPRGDAAHPARVRPPGSGARPAVVDRGPHQRCAVPLRHD